MKITPKHINEVLFTVAYFGITYCVAGIIVNAFKLDKTNMLIPLDYKYPTSSIFIIPYCFFYIYIFLGPFFISLKDTDTLHRYTTNLVITSTIGFFIFIIFPTYIDRSGFANNSFFYSTFRSICNRLDFNCNAFPSFHSMISWLIYIGIRELNIKKRHIYISLLISSSICISTVLTRQHGILDTLFALLLAELTNLLTSKIPFNVIYNKYQLKQL